MPTARSEVASWRWKASRTSQARLDGRARLCTRRNRLLLRGPQRSADRAPKHETSKNFQKTCFSPWLNRRDPLCFASSVFPGSFHGNRSDGLGGSSFRCGHRIRRDAMLLQGIDGQRTERGDRHGMPARRYQRGDKNLRGCLTRGLHAPIIVSSLRRGARVAKGGRL